MIYYVIMHNCYMLIRRMIVAFVPVIISISSSFAQLHWQKADSLFGPLPASLHVFKTNELLNGSPFIAYYVSAKLKDKNLLMYFQTFQINFSHGKPVRKWG